MDYLPIFADLKRRPCLVVGGGDSAWRKTRMLLKAGADVRVIAPRLNADFTAALASQQIKLVGEHFSPSDLDGIFLAIAATERKAINALVYQSANQRQVLVNVVDDTQRCSFIIPSIVDRSPIIVAISSSGQAPVLARLLREKLEALLPQHLGRMATIAGNFRQRLSQTVSSFSARRYFWEQAFNGRFGDLVASGREQEAEQELVALTQQAPPQGQVALIGAGPGDAGLLTLRALQLMQQADVVLYDYLVSDEVMDLVRRDAELVCVGKKAGFHSVPQEETNRLIVHYAQQGKRVVRLKGGDPFVFGRGGEELEVLFDADIPFQVVPGITAAAGATAYAGIPLTHRDYAQTAMFVTGHLKPDGDTLDWSTLARGKQTLVIYMGLMKSSHIQQQLLEHGRGADTPIAIIERGTQKTQKVLKGQLSELAELAKHAASPSLIVVGEVVNLSTKLDWFTKQEQSLQQQDAVVKLA
ncbi:uroporphyrinogen-III C-methyltransferase [Photobacterium sp. GB-27]|uniref:siroheme synthase CysG n=1 Tax=unclassified Photobacterium TaxID=2628852 RepID=UPI000D153854|nr:MULTISPECIES: siroheme synthase CysG [unclassified Photobacterium]PSV23157.1 uroporphyrinogen-III C-methyltransferase [Photobacterium sp. GB-56]PSV29983.1 uroporphyrinogen-III C-methyltransferase [Photobacterium sp. GB-72]PSV31331.1 uroporphyrinogen-III C-methyltransferase [Photobacterium sp. GB-27]PSV35182.1 uroporphyrinogen-III C-methyltransferase [Photobacterium sp. GB-210]PSV51657.1 uroporphyrinogen-III C-methyltransferase [Photobacterium sp. GB-3]